MSFITDCLSRTEIITHSIFNNLTCLLSDVLLEAYKDAFWMDSAYDYGE